jgi:hypothetical protein
MKDIATEFEYHAQSRGAQNVRMENLQNSQERVDQEQAYA